GGQYPSGSNSRPQLQLTRALNQANSITPLNALGAVDLINGKVAMIGIGASNPRTEFASFQSYCDTFQCLNKKLEVVNVCKGGIGIQKMNYDTAAYWIKANDTLVAHSLTSLQVQIVWIEQEHTQSTNTIFPNAPQQLIADYKKLLQIILIKYPNVKMAYINSRAYAGYTDNSTGAGLRAPRDYYNSWAVKWLIENQINNVAGYEYAGANANIPFIDWATNSWANGNIPKQDGLFWDCVNDFGITDGLHLSPNGEMKVGKRLFGYFSMDTTAKVWFIDATCKAITTHLGPKDIRVDNMLIYPNPVSDKLIISYKGSFGYKIYNSFGMIIVDGQHHNENSLIDVTSFEKGIYLIRTNGEINLVKTIIIN
ncbi:MAG: T9SS type A sorting domain-containing protein, partial [Bacteroidota bacterium]|nr:T9SS type A sorting domain-containing protein [Bacteroidota bacterium]